MDISSLKRKNFSPEEFIKSDTVYRLNHDANPKNDIDNSPADLNVLTALMSTADMMQEIRDLLGKPITINSAYRCKKLNDLVGSSDRSQHLKGEAVDFTCKGFGTPEEVVKFLHSKNFLADQCFNEGSWIHISRKLRKVDNRMMYGYYLPDSIGKRKFKAI